MHIKETAMSLRFSLLVSLLASPLSSTLSKSDRPASALLHHRVAGTRLCLRAGSGSQAALRCEIEVGFGVYFTSHLVCAPKVILGA